MIGFVPDAFRSRKSTPFDLLDLAGAQKLTDVFLAMTGAAEDSTQAAVVGT